MKDIQNLYPSIDGNTPQREHMVELINTLLTGLDSMKNPNGLALGSILPKREDYYGDITTESVLPQQGVSLEDTVQSLLTLTNGQRWLNSSYLANATPLPTTSSIIGNFLMTLLNGNNIWDVECSASATAEVQLTSMLSKLVGYDENKSGGYTTWGGLGAVLASLRIALAKRFPNSNQTGIPNNAYVFSSELAHFSLYKSAQTTGIGTDKLIKIKTTENNVMDINDLKEQMEKVIDSGGIPTYVLATMGSTDSFAVDDIVGIKRVCTELEEAHNLQPIFIHADSAMGGMMTFLNNYDTTTNPLDVNDQLLPTVKKYQDLFRPMHLADSMVFDFHKLGQTPYVTSMFLVKDKTDFKYVDLNPDETPYIGNRAFGSYFTSYTLECSRAGNSLPILASILNLGVEGYQRILLHYLQVNQEFRWQLQKEFPNVAITNDLSPMTTFRFYSEYGQSKYIKERLGEATLSEINQINEYNSKICDTLSVDRDEVYFGFTRKQLLLTPTDSEERLPMTVLKFFPISLHTTVEDIPRYLGFLKNHIPSKQEVGV